MALNYFRKFVKRLIVRGVDGIGFSQSGEKIAEDSQRYWSDANALNFQSNSHWRGERGLPDDTWLELGKSHLALFNDYAKLTGLVRPLERVVEWGCGGGANAVHFAKETNQFVGVDVSRPTLNECAKNLDGIGYSSFVPILIDVANPEAALDEVPGPCNLFVCTYVFELIPSPEYGERLLKIAHQLLRSGGMAIIQIKYETNEPRTKTRRWGYRRDLANMTTYPLDQFWELTKRVGFEPKAITLRPKDVLVQDERYAYFILEKPITARI